MERRYYVYAHIDRETNTPFYIGKGTGRRLYSKDRDELWKDFTQFINGNYYIEKLADDLFVNEAGLIEGEFMHKYGRLRNLTGTLTNFSIGIEIYEGPDGELSHKLNESINNYLTPLGVEFWNREDVQIPDSFLEFLKEHLQKTLQEEKEKCITFLLMKKRPIKSWTLPFKLKIIPKGNNELKIRTVNRKDLIDRINSIVDPFKLANTSEFREVDYNIRIKENLNNILYSSVSLEHNGVVITGEEWFLSAIEQKKYLKILQAENNGLNLYATIHRLNKHYRYNYERSDIWDIMINLA